MIERQFVSQKIKEFQIHEYVKAEFTGTGFSHIEVQRTPLGEKVVIFTTRPGLVVGKKGENIRRLTNVLKKKFSMENPQIEIGEIQNPMLDANFVADRISSTLVRFGSKRFKSVGYKTLQDIINSGALGAEIVISGKVPSARARSWRFKAGHLKKSGYIASDKVKKAVAQAKLKSGIIGIKVSIMTPDVVLPDKILVLNKENVLVEKPLEQAEAKIELKTESKEEVPGEALKEASKKKRTRKTKEKVEEKTEELKEEPVEETPVIGEASEQAPKEEKIENENK